MGQYLGMAPIEQPTTLGVLARSGAAPVALDAPPTYRIYGPAGVMQNGTGTASPVAGATGMYQVAFTPQAANGFLPGLTYSILWAGTISGGAWGDLSTFTVV